jgi:hypothetical protein
VEITKASFEISHEADERESEAFGLKQSVSVVSEINSILDSL